jgi:hypothetical protein
MLGKKSFFIVPVLTLLLLSCSLNRFESNSFVGYIEDGKIGTHYLEGQNNPKSVIDKGACIVVDLVGGYLHDDFEPWHEDIFTKGPVRNEIALIIKTQELPSPIGADKKPVSNSEQALLTFKGQQANRPFPVQYYTIFGPKKYEGGDLLFDIKMTELDEEEMNMLKGNVATLQSNLQQKATSQRKDWTTVESKLIEFLATGVLKVAAAEWAGLGFDAAIQLTKLYADLHKEDDGIMNHYFMLTSQYRKDKTSTPILREGYYVVVRANIDDKKPEKQNYIGSIDTVIKKDETFNFNKMELGGNNNTWLVLRVSTFPSGDTCPCK